MFYHQYQDIFPCERHVELGFMNFVKIEKVITGIQFDNK